MIRTHLRRVMLAALLFLMLAGCSVTRMSQSPREIDPTELEKLKPGTTTKEEVICLFGPPVAVSLNSNNQEVYTFVSGDVRSQMWQIPPILVIYVDSVSSAKTKVLNVTFSGNTVVNWNYTVSAAGGGFQAGGVQGGKLGN